MSTAAIVGIAVAALVVLAVILLVATARRTDARRGEGYLSRETVARDEAARASSAELVSVGPSGREVEAAALAGPSTAVVRAESLPPVPYVPPDPEAVGVTRRQFFNRSAVTLTTVGLGAFGAAVLAFLWSAPSGGFGGKINAGKLNDIRAGILQGKGFFYVPEARSWITEYPLTAVSKAESVYPAPIVDTMRNGITVLYQKCPHLGCRVPECTTSQWFECPCHGSQYNRNGEKKAGPAPRGMDLFSASISPAGDVVIDTGLVFQGAPIGSNTTGQEAEGPHCVGATEE